MKLRVLEGKYAVCRLPAASAIPPWVLEGQSSSEQLYSITKTTDELSIVCRQDHVPAAESTTTTATTTDAAMKIEKDWSCLMVVGPLEFSMTGVLASLASPLAEAGVSIFAVSTYNTDYLLVKCQTLDRAIKVLTESGHLVENSNVVEHAMENNRPRDGPALSFETDPLVAILVEGKDQHPEPLFNLCLVTGWPPDKHSLMDSYERFCQAVDQCWNPPDRSRTCTHPPVYLYPFTSLHATAATFFRPGKLQITPQQQSKLLQAWSAVVRIATEDPEWPTEPLLLRIVSAQIGARAGILLWNDETGGMEAIRSCLKKACKAESAAWLLEEKNDDNLLAPDTLDIPPIIHSTFLRFYQQPETPGHVVQERFQTLVLSKLHEFFPDPFHVPIATFVCERTPYMHIPFDAEHVRASLFFTPQRSSSQADRYVTDCGEAMQRLQSLRNPVS